MSDNPLREGQNSEVIANLVQEAAGTHRQPKEEQPKEESDRATPLYPSEEKRVNRKITLDLDPPVKERLRKTGFEIGGRLGISAVAQALIEYALDTLESGQIALDSRVEDGKIRFDAVETSGNTK